MILFAKQKQRFRCREQMYRHQGEEGVAWTGRLGLTVGLSGFPVAQTVKNLPAMQATWVWSWGQEKPLEKGMAAHSSILAWRISWTEEAVCPWGWKELDTTERLTFSLSLSVWDYSLAVLGVSSFPLHWLWRWNQCLALDRWLKNGVNQGVNKWKSVRQSTGLLFLMNLSLH